MEHLALELVVELHRERNQHVRQQSRQGEATIHGRNYHTQHDATQLRLA
jgi:hypothetical protein